MENFELKWVLFSTRLPVSGKSVLIMDKDGYFHTLMSWDDYSNNDEVKKWAYLPATKWPDEGGA